MTFIGILAFSVVCSILKKQIESFLFAFPFMMIAAYFFFSGGPFWIATGIATSTLLGGPRPDEDSFVVFCRYPMFNAKYDVNVLASAFNMEKADFMGRLFLIDDWTSFDNERFEVIRANSDGIEEVTAGELALLANVKAVLIDEEWFQVYDNNNKFTEKYVASGLYWNYFYHTWKTVSYSPFSNAVMFVTDTANIALPAEITIDITDKSVSEDAITLTVEAKTGTPTLQSHMVNFIQTEQLTTDGIAVHKFGAYMIPASKKATEIQVVAEINGTKYTNAGTKLTANSAVGESLVLTKQ